MKINSMNMFERNRVNDFHCTEVQIGHIPSHIFINATKTSINKAKFHFGDDFKGRILKHAIALFCIEIKNSYCSEARRSSERLKRRQKR